ncbi:MAG: hypothetical protein K2H90_04210 [Oscillospiraceae bacterium]|nr:hypothetical protein [Oscillospiraceae bacterium]MDE6133725.1 hypothetical protein [Oscillospiraceae bacterium]
MDKYNYYFIIINGGRYVYRARCTVKSISIARKFRTKPQAVNYARKYYSNSEFTVKGGGGIKSDEIYEY